MMLCPKCGEKMRITNNKVNLTKKTMRTLYRCLKCGFNKRMKRKIVTEHLMNGEILIL